MCNIKLISQLLLVRKKFIGNIIGVSKVPPILSGTGKEERRHVKHKQKQQYSKTIKFIKMEKEGEIKIDTP